jgi:hypothetical protein
VLAIGLIVVVAILIGFGLGSLFRGGDSEVGSGSPSASPSAPASESASVPPPSASAPASAAPQASGPPPVVAAPEGLIPPGSAVRVLIEGLRMREGPSTEATLIDSLPVDQLLLVGYSWHRPADWGPVSAGGFAWYPVIRLGEGTDLPALSDGLLVTTSPVGWVAAGDVAEAYIQLLDPRCPPRPVSLATLEAMQPWEQLACFGSEQITLDGTFGCGECGGLFLGTFEPAWLASPAVAAFLSIDPNTRIGPFSMHFPPGAPAVPADGQILRVVGHFDDPAAIGCTVSPGETPVPVDARAAELYCREQFVVESFAVTGTDPDFP